VLEILGRGGMGEVYAAYDPELDRKIALKILHAGGPANDSRGRSRLLREAKAIAKLRHPNVIAVHDAGTLDDRVFLAMEHVEGMTLGAWLAERPRTRQEILNVFVAAGRGLEAAHAAGLVHRDFKPQNVMVGRDGDVRVMDFGLARSIDEEPEPVPGPAALAAAQSDLAVSAGAPGRAALPLTRTGELVGTPLYMAPEQFRAERTDARTDQFSFCVALYQALYGAYPFAGAGFGELMAAVNGGQVQPPPAKSAVPPWLRRILLRGLSVDPAARWPSMQVLTAALGRDPARRRNRWLARGDPRRLHQDRARKRRGELDARGAARRRLRRKVAPHVPGLLRSHAAARRAIGGGARPPHDLSHRPTRTRQGAHRRVRGGQPHRRRQRRVGGQRPPRPRSLRRRPAAPGGGPAARRPGRPGPGRPLEG
jgi:serine/threonine protein kinase